MNYRIGLLFAVFLCAACAKERRLGVTERYVLAFEEASIRAGKPVKVDNLIIEFSPSGKNFATCEERTFHTPRIIITQSHWNMANELQREVILFHELGHCVLGRDHIRYVKRRWMAGEHNAHKGRSYRRLFV